MPDVVAYVCTNAWFRLVARSYCYKIDCEQEGRSWDPWIAFIGYSRGIVLLFNMSPKTQQRPNLLCQVLEILGNVS